MEIFLAFLGTVGYLAAPILLAALGGMLCEKSGVVNLALEGLMISGAFVAATVQVLFYAQWGAFTWIIATVGGGLMGMIFALLFAYAIVSMGTNQTITGIGINVLALGLSVSSIQLIFNQERSPTFFAGMPRDPVLNFYPSVYLALFFFIVIFIFLNYSQAGLRLSACGENPEAVEAAGLRVKKFRYFAIISSGVLASLGGACLVLTSTTQYSRMTISGQGFIALSAVAFGQWKSERILLASLVFGGSIALAVYSSGITWLNYLPPELFSMMPYLLNVVALVLFSRSGTAPQALGRPYSGR